VLEEAEMIPPEANEVPGRKWQNTHFAETFQQNAPCLKLFRDMSMF